METVLQIIEVCLVDMVPTEDLSCWREHVAMNALLCRSSWSETDLFELEQRISAWKAEFHRLHKDVLDIFQRNKQQVIKPLLFEFPNFGSIEHWVEQIPYIGPPWLQSTKLWEHRHLDCKVSIATTNLKQSHRDVMVKVCPLAPHLTLL